MPEGLHAVVERRDALKVKMVRRLVENKEVCAREHHLAYHAPYLFAAGEHLHGLVYIIAGEEHTPEEGAQIALALVFGKLADPVHEVIVAVFKEAVVILGKIRLRDRGAPFNGARVRLLLAHEYLEQHGDGKLVLAEDSYLVLLADDEAYVVQKLHSVHGLADLCDEKPVLAGLAVGLEAHPGIAPAGCGKLLHGELIQQLSAAGSLTGFGLVGGKAGDEALQLGDLLLGLFVLVLNELLHELAGLVPEIVVADIHLYLAVVYIDDVGADVVEKVAVMRHDEHRALVVHEKILEPYDAGKVEVVRRLVEQYYVRASEQSLGQQYLDLHSRVHIPHGRIVKGGGHAETLQNAACVGLCLPAAQLGKFLLKLCGAYAVLVGEIGLVVNGVLLLAAVVKALVSHYHRVHDGIIVVHILILFENAHALFRRYGNAAGRGLKLAGQDLYEGRLARAVRADDAVAVSGGKLQVNAGKQHVARKIYGKVVYRYHSLYLGLMIKSILTFQIIIGNI